MKNLLIVMMMIMTCSLFGQTHFEYEIVGDSAYNFTTIDSSYNNVRVRSELNVDTVQFLDVIRSRAQNLVTSKSLYNKAIQEFDDSYNQLSLIHFTETGETLDDFFNGLLVGSLNGDWEFDTKSTGKLDVTITDTDITDGATNGVVTYMSSVEISINWNGTDYLMYKTQTNRYEGVDAQNKKTSLSKP